MTRVLVTKATTVVGVALQRALSRSGFEVLGADDRRLPFGLRTRRSSLGALYPRPEDPAFAARILDLLHATRPDVLLPVETPLVELAAREAEVFAPLTAVSVPEPGNLAALTHATTAARACAEAGVACPALYTVAEGDRLLEGGGTQLVVKPDREVGGAQGVAYVRDAAGLGAAIARCETDFGPAVIQEYIPGGPEAMRNALLLFDREGRLLACFTLRKLRQWPPEGGITALGISTDDRGLLEAVLPLFRRRPWRGFAEAEFKVDERDGVPKLIEINPRLTAYAGFPGRCGLALPALGVRAALGEARGGGALPRYRTGVRFVNPGPFLAGVRREARSGAGWGRALSNALRQTRGWCVTNSRDLADPAPVAGRLLRAASRRLRSSKAP
jgi:predicted ATP-grasp superfamily ATP-dependent carboligase